MQPSSLSILSRPGPGASLVLGRARAVVSSITPIVDGGRFAVKRRLGEPVDVTAIAFVDGHDAMTCHLLHRHETEERWDEVVLQPQGNDTWTASFTPERIGRHLFTVTAAVDHWGSWRHGTQKKIDAASETGAELAVDLEVGARLATELAVRAREAGAPATALAFEDAAQRLRNGDLGIVDDELLAQTAAEYPEPDRVTWGQLVPLDVDPPVASTGFWYELFPRSLGSRPGEHGTLREVEAHLDYVEQLGADVLYLPPIHPIGRAFRKGPNNSLTAGERDPGSPWAIGGDAGGHLAVHPHLGTVDDLIRLVDAARRRRIEVALDLAFQCSPDHPWVREHPEWFTWRPDGTIQYAENPPKKYQDIVPFNFECETWPDLWLALLHVVRYWMDAGVRVFRVDNPHTKPFAFWEWLIGEVRADRPDVVFLAEAFTRPAPLHRLAKLGFHQSYNYFPWRTTKLELQEYLTELSTPPGVDYLRPALWVNTPDILTEELQSGRPARFRSRALLASTLGQTWGMYGPAFELMEHEPVREGSEEYLGSEKYQLRTWDLHDERSLAPFIARLNTIRRAHPALTELRSLSWHEVPDDWMLVYSKGRSGSTVLVCALLDTEYRHDVNVRVDLDAIGMGDAPIRWRDLLSGRELWGGRDLWVWVDPEQQPGLILVPEVWA